MSAVARLLDPEPLPTSTAVVPHGAAESVLGAAVLVATAFRLRDEDALVVALRRLVEAVRRLEDERA